ncbi:hypothetical protein [Microbacterium murale]|uniref:HNH endonuclease n=1 Tax=Microbacterium murale TaxID=1081040 RepID=A0ABU0P8T4_9MICO|nr:hypothetical protein [Microbacterium murale]MDQ0643756.1 hypothetical protein [Microbacterium murale]
MAGPVCWWCGALADSREHKFAAAELRLNHGRGSWSGDNAVVHFSSDVAPTDVRGAKADILKWEPSLCRDCNNARSHPFDHSYITLLKYLDTHEVVGESGLFAFSDVYGGDWELSRANLIKYWVKHICCRATVIGLSAPKALVEYLDDLSAVDDPPHIGMQLLVNASVFEFERKQGMGRGSGFADAEGFSLDGELVGFESYVYWGWLALRYRFDLTDPDGWTSFPDDDVEMQRVATK